MNGNWYKPDCKRCEHFISELSFGFIESKECSLSPLEKCPYENESNDEDDNKEDREETISTILSSIDELDDFGATQTDYQEIITYLERRIIVNLRRDIMPDENE